MKKLCVKFMRKKVVDRDETTTELNRVLSTIDLTLLGIGSTLGLGVYVLAGSVAKDSAGPAVIISFLIAGLASVMSGICYAEFGSRVPKAGSAYVYSYVCVGELIAFIVGWNLIMEYVIGVASVAKGYSGYVDQLFDHHMSHVLETYVPIGFGFLADFFDFFAFAITMVLTLLLAFGVKESSLFNNVFTGLNLFVVLFVVVAGSIYADPKNWALSKEDILRNNSTISEEKIGQGGFAPFGFSGIMKGAATCFYGFVGFDCIATTGEEAKNPQRAIPLSIMFSLLFIFLAYFGISAVVTMMVPYYLQDAEAPLPQAFAKVGFTTGQWIVTIGALFGLSTSLLGAMFPMPRVIYAMASDGVLFKFLSTVHPRFQTPLIATFIAGTFGGLMAALFKLEALIDMMSIGTLTAYTLVAICVLCLRFRKDVDGADDNSNGSPPSDASQLTMRNYLRQVFNSEGLTIPTELSSSYTNWAVVLYCLSTIAFCAVAIFAEEEMLSGEVIIILLLVLFGCLMLVLLASLGFQPVSRVQIAFKVPYVPILPGLSILANTYLMLKLSWLTWVRFAVWMLVGFIIYGICILKGTTDTAYEASVERKHKRKYSNVSASGFHPKEEELSPSAKSEDIDVRKVVPENGNYNPDIECIRLDTLDSSGIHQEHSKRSEIVENQNVENAVELFGNEERGEQSKSRDSPTPQKIEAIDVIKHEPLARVLSQI